MKLKPTYLRSWRACVHHSSFDRPVTSCKHLKYIFMITQGKTFSCRGERFFHISYKRDPIIAGEHYGIKFFLFFFRQNLQAF